MTPNLSKFVFDYNPLANPEDFIAKVPAGLSGLGELFQALRRELHLPDYFGENWDALSDCLRDLSWIKSRRVIILHDDLPRLDTRALTTYLDVLSECTRDWRPGEDHELFAAFPENIRTTIFELITQSGSQ